MVLQTAVGGDQEDEYEKVQESKLEVTTPQEYFARFAAKKLPKNKKGPLNKVKNNPNMKKKVPPKRTPVPVSENIVISMHCSE